MNFFSRLTNVGKATLIICVVAVIGAILYFSGATKSLGGISFGGDKPVTVAVNTYSGFLPIIGENSGVEPNVEAEIYKKYGIKVKFLIMDDFTACRAAFNEGTVDVAYCTLDALPVEMSSAGTMSDSRYFMLLNFSHGADALVVDGTINTIGDLKGKKVAYAEGTASQTLLINALETSGLSMSDIVPVKVENGTDAATAFKSGSVSACVTWSPDDEEACQAIKGAKILTSTANANALVTDGFIAKKDWLDKNQETAVKLVEAFLWANSNANTNPEAFKKGAEIFAKEFESNVEFAMNSGKKINYATLADNVNWFGLNSDYNGMTGERIYTKMSRAYTELNLTKNVIPWSKVAYTGIIEKILESGEIDNNQDANGTAKTEFSAPTEKLIEAKAVSQKKVTINFPTAGYTLDNQARAIIDREFLDIIRSFASVRIRIVGNTDNTGNYDSNIALSQKRAEAVVNYLVKEYNIDKNRFVVVGNGPKKAIADNVQGANENYRTTDLELLNE